MAASDPRIRISEVALSDEEFDRWIIASDVVVLPYRASWSSGVAERAKLFGRKLIVSGVGGLIEQTDEGDIVFQTDEGLGEAMNQLAGDGDATSRSDKVMSAAEAQEIVREEGRRLRSALSGEAPTEGGPTSVEEAMQKMTMHSGLQTFVAPSGRPVIGPVLTIIKKVVRRLVGWYVEPLVATINEFQIATLRTLTSLASEVETLRHRVESLEEKVATEQDRTSDLP
ncbi:MAG: hypothetical protein ACRD1T_21520 [Acidimicrobiia bacterium]